MYKTHALVHTIDQYVLCNLCDVSEDVNWTSVHFYFHFRIKSAFKAWIELPWLGKVIIIERQFLIPRTMYFLRYLLNFTEIIGRFNMSLQRKVWWRCGDQSQVLQQLIFPASNNTIISIIPIWVLKIWGKKEDDFSNQCIFPFANKIVVSCRTPAKSKGCC